MNNSKEPFAKAAGQPRYDAGRIASVGNTPSSADEVRQHACEAGPECAAARTRQGTTELRLRRIAIKSKGRILFLDTDSILAVEAEGNYVRLVCQSASHLLRETISTLARELESYGFVRIHRSILVNSTHVQQIQPCATGDYALRLQNGKEYSVARTYRKSLRLLAGYWIGADGFLSA